MGQNLNNKNSLLSIFSKIYPNPRSELNFCNEYQLLVSVILSAQCTDKKVNEVTPTLFEKYPDFFSLNRGRVPSLEKIIRPINYYRTKSKNLLGMAKLVVANFGGKVPKNMEALVSLPGVGRKTANVVLNELGIQATLPVDTHVFRVSRRLGLAKSEKVEQLEEELRNSFPSEIWRNLHHWLIFHGRRICKAQRPACTICQVAKYCPSKQES